MRISRLFGLFLVLVTALAVACGGGSGGNGDDDGDDAPPIDAPDNPQIDAPPSGGNALGQLCPVMAGGGGTMCPAGNSCVRIEGVGTNMNTGYCTPDCMNMTPICTAGYTGPAGGQPQCALSPAMGQPPNGCAIVCTAQAQCGTGLTCTPVPGQAVMVCVPT